MKTITNVARMGVIAALLAVGAAAAMGATADDDLATAIATGEADPPVGRGRLVATVDALELYENDLVPAKLKERMTPDEYNARLKQNVDHAIENGLLYRAAMATGLEESDAYQQQFQAFERATEQGDLSRLAAWHERSVDELAAARDSSTVSAEEIAAYAKEHPELVAGRSGERLDRVIRSLVANERHGKAHSAWLNNLVSDATVAVNGKTIDAKILTERINNVYRAAPPPQPDPLGAEVLKLAGITLPTVVDDETMEELTEQIGNVVLAIDDVKLTLGELPQFDNLAEAIVRDSVGLNIVTLIRTYVVSAAARKAGADEDPQFVAHRKQLAGSGGGDALLGNPGPKEILIDVLLREQGLRGEGLFEVDDAEIDEYLEKHRDRFSQLTARRGGAETARTSIARLLASEKAAAAKQAYVAKLREKGKVKVLVDCEAK